MKRWLVVGLHGETIVVEQEDTAVGAAYAAADRYGMAHMTLHVTRLDQETTTFQRGWVKTSDPIDS